MRLNIDLTQDKVERNVFFISDFHLFHKNVLRFDNRPFNDVHEMQDTIENNWNSVVGENDIVIYLGDLSFAKSEEKPLVDEFLNKLNGTIHFIIGNHDKFEEIKRMTRFQSVSDYLEVRITHLENNKKTETLFTCMHYPIYNWNKAHHGSIHIHGHTHMNLQTNNQKWVSRMQAFSQFIPDEKLAEFRTLVEEKDYYDKRVIDAGCMGWDYKPISYKKVIDVTKNNNTSHHH